MSKGDSSPSLRRRLLLLRRWTLAILRPLWASFRDLLPIIAVVGLFQIFVFGTPFDDMPRLVAGMGLIILGLTLFVVGLEIGLFPIGEQLAFGLAKKGSVVWLLLFAFTLGFGTTLAEPALIAIANKAAGILVTSQGEGGNAATYAFALRFTVAVSVGTALAVGALRIILGWPIQWFILAGYVLVLLLTPFAPRSIQALAYDSGGVTTSTITVPLTTALGVGLASSIKGRNALQDGFGMIALASVMPILFVLIFGIAWQ